MTEIMRGGNMVGHWHFVLTDYHPSDLGFEDRCGTMVDDECEHGRTPRERISDPSICACGGSPQNRRTLCDA